MSDTIKMVVVLSFDQAQQFGKSQQIKGLDTIPHVDKRIKAAIQQEIVDRIGFDNSPIACLSRFNGEEGELRNIGSDAARYLPTGKGDKVLLEIHTPQDMILTASYSAMMECSALLSGATDEVEVDIYLNYFINQLKLGDYDEDEEDVVAFTPYIALTRCKYFALLDKDWQAKDFSLPGVEQVKLNNMQMFDE